MASLSESLNLGSTRRKVDQLIELCFMPLSTVFHRLGLCSVLVKDTPIKNPEDPVHLKPRIPGLQVEHFTTEPHRTLKGN